MVLGFRMTEQREILGVGASWRCEGLMLTPRSSPAKLFAASSVPRGTRSSGRQSSNGSSWHRRSRRKRQQQEQEHQVTVNRREGRPSARLPAPTTTTTAETARSRSRPRRMSRRRPRWTRYESLQSR